MFYQCGRCQAIYANENEAGECCAPIIRFIKDEEVQACINHDPLASVCYRCKGTGLIKKNPGLKEVVSNYIGKQD